MISTFISIIIPGFNEERRIQKTLKTLCDFCCNQFLKFEILFIDDGSIDKTRSMVEQISKKNIHIRSLGYSKNLGKGYAIRYGLRHAKGKYIFFTDADLPYDPNFFCQAIETFEKTGCDIVVGNRQLPQSKDEAGLSRKRLWASRIFSQLVQNMFNISIKDTQCGVKGFSKLCSHEIVKKSYINGYAFDVEIFVLAHKNGWRLESLPVTLVNDQLSKIRLGFDSFNILWEMLKLASKHNN
ncbi:glycosyl transferase family protein [Candidatus Magnetomorum sp. HK-1]|nr:glycosyl transferase family protein [Candidatus Magnetomorum sp. HK-1]